MRIPVRSGMPLSQPTRVRQSSVWYRKTGSSEPSLAHSRYRNRCALVGAPYVQVMFDPQRPAGAVVSVGVDSKDSIQLYSFGYGSDDAVVVENLGTISAGKSRDVTLSKAVRGLLLAAGPPCSADKAPEFPVLSVSLTAR